jgi:hypothetical protein
VAQRRDIVGVALVGFGLYLVSVALFIVVAPRAFFDTLGPFDRFSQHYLQDPAAFEGALGVGLLMAAARPSWRVPLLIVAGLHFSFHAISHGVDIGDADPTWVGPAEFAGLVVASVILFALARVAAREERAQIRS